MRLEKSTRGECNYDVMDGEEYMGCVYLVVSCHNKLHRDLIERWIVKAANKANDEADKCSEKL